MASSDNTLAGLAEAINAANIGVTAAVNATAVGRNAAGTLLTLTSGTVGAAGALSVTSNIVDQTNVSTTPLNYSNSSDINSLTSLGISVNNDGSLTFDATSLDSVLNSDYSSVAGFFQNANSWGQTFSTMLTNAGTSSATGVLALASSSNSNIESTLNADISKEESLISAQQSSLTTELNSANQIMQQLPSQLQGVNELYSAITGYDQNHERIRSSTTMPSYQEHALEGASAVDLVVALYDGIIRFLHAAAEAVDRGDAERPGASPSNGRSISSFTLQARLRMDVGGEPAQALSEFYASIFAQILQASQSASRRKFEHAIDCVRNVRDAWRAGGARDPT